MLIYPCWQYLEKYVYISFLTLIIFCSKWDAIENYIYHKKEGFDWKQWSKVAYNHKIVVNKLNDEKVPKIKVDYKYGYNVRYIW